MLNITNYQGNANQKHNEISSIPVGMAMNKKQKTSVGEHMEKRETSGTAGRNVSWCSHCGKQYGGFSKN